MFHTLDEAEVRGKRVLVRVDLNVPVENGKVADTTRIERVAPTIREIADKGGKVILLSHFGRPKGSDPAQSLKLLTPAIAAVLKRPVAFRRAARRARRHLRQRRLLGGAPRSRLGRGHRPPATDLCWPHHAG